MSTTTLDLGPVRPVHKGAWSSTATYELLNIVSYNGGSWMMAGASYTVGTTPVVGATWALIAAKGDPGPVEANFAGTQGEWDALTDAEQVAYNTVYIHEDA